MGEPEFERIKKATRVAKEVKVYSFNSKSDVWWQQSKNKFIQLSASVYQLPWESIQTLASFIERSMAISVTITGESAFVAAERGECEINWCQLS
jgi:uncharacterized protein YaeQ